MNFRLQSISKAATLFLFILVCGSAVGQGLSGIFSAVGTGEGATREEALEAARLDAVNTLIFSVLKKDRVYRDLFVPEAFRNGWFHDPQAHEGGRGRWSAKTEIRVDESLVEALYVGRYSTTVVNLLDSAETDFAEAEFLLAEAGRFESNAELAGAETAYRRSEAKADEILRYLGPVEDAVYFSTLGNRKALELKALVQSLRASAREGTARIRSGLQSLALDRQASQVLATLDRIDSELPALASIADTLHSPASAPRSYTTEFLRSSRDRGQQARNTLSHRRKLVLDAVSNLPPGLKYPRSRATFLLDRIDELNGRLQQADTILARELIFRSSPVRAALWVLNHEPSDRASLSIMSPWAVTPQDGGSHFYSLPPYFEGRAEGSIGLGEGGFWFRTQVRSGRETILDTSDTAVRQGVEAGFFDRNLYGIGIAWDWLRSDGNGETRDGILSVSFITGSYGSRGTSPMDHPLWITAYSWEVPRESAMDPIELLNLGISTVLRPGRSIRLEGDLAGRVRYLSQAALPRRWEGTAGVGFAFRLPVLRPLLWRIRWEGALRAPVENGEVRFHDGESFGAFRFGLEYTF